MFESAKKLTATRDLVAIYLMSLKIIGQWGKHDNSIIKILATEIDQLMNLPEADCVEGMTGYAALFSLLSRIDIVIPASPKFAIIPALIEINAGQPLWKCNPLGEWMETTENLNIDAAVRIFSWEHLCFIYLYTLGILLQNGNINKESRGSFNYLDHKIFKMLLILNLGEYRNGIISSLGVEKPDNVSVAFVVAIQTIYERYKYGAAINLFIEIREREQKNFLSKDADNIPVVFRARGLSYMVPDVLDDGNPDTSLSMQISALIETSTLFAFKTASILNDNISPSERIIYLSDNDPIFEICSA